MKVLKVIGLVLLAGVLGTVPWMAIMFTAFSGVEETVIFVVGFFAFFIAGLIIGVISPKWWPLAILTSWVGPMVFIEAITMSVRYERAEIELEDLIWLVPLGAALLGGYVGKLLRTLRR